ncbi:MAG: efflux RND transporter permease subunit, partial [Vulcanimicrobiaceae bacterium]
MRVTGELTRQLTVSPKPGALEALDASVLDLYRAIGKGNDIFPGGRINAGPRDLTVGIAAAALGADRLAQLPEPLAASSSVRVDDVATVSDGYADRSVLSRVDQDPAILLAVAHARGADAIRTIAAARKTVAALARRYPEIRFQELRTDAPYTSAALDGVLQTLGEGIALTVVVMLLFLHAWRNAGIAAIAIPASLCAAFATMW